MTQDEVLHELLDAGLPICGCGDPGLVILALNKLLAGDNGAHVNMDKILSMMTANPEAASYMIAYWLNHAGICEHGTSIHYQWLTPKGEIIKGLLDTWEASER